jgi:hypothetical protein
MLFKLSTASSGSYTNQWTGWYSSGKTVSSGDGKYPEYDSMQFSTFRFVVGGDSAEFKTSSPTSMLGLVQGAVSGSPPSNSANSAWNNGHKSYTWTKKVGSSVFKNSALKVGVGDQSEAADWALFDFEHPSPRSNGAGDYSGAQISALGSETRSYTKDSACGSGCSISINCR